MPNWCNNTLTVTKTSHPYSNQDFAGFMSKSRKDGLFKMNGTYPTPPPLLDAETTSDIKESLRQEYGYDNWYDWRIENWGTKWDADKESQQIIKDTDEAFIISFDTAWSPPIEWINKVSILYPTLVFSITFMEEGMGFCGIYKNVNGDSELEQGDIRYIDEDGEEVKWDNKLNCNVYAETNEKVDEDTSIYPENPFEN